MATGRRAVVTLFVAPYYYQGEDAYFEIEHRVDGVLTDATAVPTVSVKDNVGTMLFTDQNSTKDSTGEYHYECVLGTGAVLGPMTVQVSATYDSITNLHGHAVSEILRKVA